MRRSLIPVLILAALAFMAGLGRGAITDSDEAFYAEAAREMVASGDWLTPHFNYEIRFQKPALYYWLTASVFAVTGATEFGARLWAALAGVGLVLITTACARRWFDELTGLLAGAIVATSFGYFALARMALPDLPLAFFVTLAIWSAFTATLERERHPRRWLYLSAVAAALGFLMKGPLALALPGLVVVPILLMERRSFSLGWHDVATAFVLFLLIASPWYIAMWVTHGNAYLSGFFLGDNVERFMTTRFNDHREWWFYGPVVAGGLLPWAPLALLWLGPVLQFFTRRRDIGTLDLRLLLWAALPLLFFTASIGKQPRYILPVLPPLAILLAGSIIERTSEWRSLDGSRVRPRPNRLVVAGFVVAGLLFVGLAAAVFRAAPLFLGVSETTNLVVVAILGLCGAAVVIVSLSGAWRASPAVLALAAAVSWAALPYAIYPSAGHSAVSQMANVIRQVQRPGESLGTYKVFVRNLVFYTGRPHHDLIHDEHLLEWLRTRGGGLIVMPTDDADRLERVPGLRFERVAALPYFDEGSVRARTLLWPDTARDLTQVVLVRVAR